MPTSPTGSRSTIIWLTVATLPRTKHRYAPEDFLMERGVWRFAVTESHRSEWRRRTEQPAAKAAHAGHDQIAQCTRYGRVGILEMEVDFITGDCNPQRDAIGNQPLIADHTR